MRMHQDSDLTIPNSMTLVVSYQYKGIQGHNHAENLGRV